MTRTVVENPDEHGVSPALTAMLDVLPYAAAFFGQDLVCRHANPQFKLAVASPDLSRRPSVGRLLGDWVEAALRERWGGNVPEGAWDCRLDRADSDGAVWFGRLSGHVVGLDETDDGFVAVLEDGPGTSGEGGNGHERKARPYRDPLTGMLVRRSFLEESERRVASDPASFWLAISLDFDQFRTINDSLGYHGGDMVLRMVAERIVSALPDRAVVCRTAADGFGALVPVSGPEEARSVVNVFAEHLKAPIHVSGQIVVPRMSIGAAAGTAAGPRGVALVLTQADQALQEAQSRGGNVVCIHSSDMDGASSRRTSITVQLVHALQRQELSLVYQPIVDSVTGKIVAVEALSRWHHPTLGPVSPMEFIPIAEVNGQMAAITQWVIDTLVAQIEVWRVQEIDVPRVYLNLAGPQFIRSHFPRQLCELIAAMPHLAGCIGVEIAEEAIVGDVGAVVNVVSELIAAGIDVVIDDFGSGYSSLRYVQQLPVSALKIDGMFLDQVPSDARNTALARAMVGMAHGLGLKVVAEGIETGDQYAFLLGLGCDMIQGYLFAHPVPAHDIVELLRRPRLSPSQDPLAGMAAAP